jgi:3-methyl-2-oxobutanoate hydroxymethyltransferase
MGITVRTFREYKRKQKSIVMLTAYDYSTAKLAEKAGIEFLLVGDSLGMVVLGYDSTVPVTMDEMIHHTKAVMRGRSEAMVIADMPFMSYQSSSESAILNAGRFLKETGCHAVKLEGGAHIAATIEKMVTSGIPVMGHVGLTPQSIHQLGGFRAAGRSKRAALKLIEDARILQESGAFSIVLEAVPANISQLISERLKIPTIGIGSGAGCDGQVQVVDDILGIYLDIEPHHAHRFATVGELMESGINQYREAVEKGDFPSEEHGFSLDEKAFEEVKKMLED